MPFAIRHEDGITTICLTGSTTGNDIVSAARALLDHSDLEGPRPYIWDARGVTELLLDLDQMQAVRDVWAECLRRRLHNRSAAVPCSSAIVAVREIDFATARLFRAYLRGHPVRIFDRMDAARAWVLLPERG